MISSTRLGVKTVAVISEVSRPSAWTRGSVRASWAPRSASETRGQRVSSMDVTSQPYEKTGAGVSRRRDNHQHRLPVQSAILGRLGRLRRLVLPESLPPRVPRRRHGHDRPRHAGPRAHRRDRLREGRRSGWGARRPPRLRGAKEPDPDDDLRSLELAILVATAMLTQRASSTYSITPLCEMTGAVVTGCRRPSTWTSTRRTACSSAARRRNSRCSPRFLGASVSVGGSCVRKLSHLEVLAEGTVMTDLDAPDRKLLGRAVSEKVVAAAGGSSTSTPTGFQGAGPCRRTSGA